MPQQIGRRAAPRLQGLDALRGIAALTVVLYHFTLGYQEVLRQHRLGLLFVVSNGHFAVNLFFIISGFVIFMTLESSAGAADFAVSRFAPIRTRRTRSTSCGLLIHFREMGQLKAKSRFTTVPETPSARLDVLRIDGESSVTSQTEVGAKRCCGYTLPSNICSAKIRLRRKSSSSVWETVVCSA